MTIQFKDIPIGTVFYLHHKNGMKGIKQSTRTARAIGPTDSVFNPRIFYVRQKETVHIDEQSKLPVTAPGYTGFKPW